QAPVPHRRVLRDRRRDAGSQRVRAQPPARAAQDRESRCMNAQAVRFSRTGGPEVLHLEEVEVGRPGPGQARIRHAAVGLNFDDPYSRPGLYPVPLPNGIGVEAAGVVEEVGEGVANVKPGDRVTYTGFMNTLGAYSTERLIPAAPLIKLPDEISCETA